MTSQVTVLVADDEDRIRDGCQRILTGHGFQVIQAENGRVALDMLAANDVDLVLLDLKMPVMDGEEVLEIAHRQYPDVPVIIITGHGTIDTAVDCMKKGAYDFITKPFHMRQFMITINRAAEKRRLAIQARIFQQENIRNLYDLTLEKGRLNTIIYCLANGVMVTNRHLEVVLHNPALMRLLDITEEIQTPAALTRIMTDESIIKSLQKIQSGQVSASDFIAQEIKVKNRHLRAITAPVIGPSEQIAGTVTLLEDVTVFKQLDQMKSDFLNMVAHELRNPLYSVRQLINVQLEGLCGPIQDKQRDYLGRSVKQLDNLLELIRDLLEVSKAEAGMLVQHLVPVNLEAVVRELFQVMEARANLQKIELSLTCQNLKPVLADVKSIREVFNNLLSNAINYSPDGGRVGVFLQGLGEFMEIKVSDTGVGIAPEELNKIFDKFYRVKHPKTRQVVGTGLGLSLVKTIIEAHHGTLEVESMPQEGTTFRILLPVMK